jgi:hypothetical protein
MGISSSKIDCKTNDVLEKNDLVNVNFIQLKKGIGCNVLPEQLNVLLGLNVPKFSELEGTEYPYLFCVSSVTDINKIIKEYRYVIGFETKQKVLRDEFNHNHRTACSYSGNEYYKLVSC